MNRHEYRGAQGSGRQGVHTAMPIHMTVGFMMRRLSERLTDDERGATSIEYALIAIGIALAIASAVVLLGSSLSAAYQSIIAAF